MTGSPADVKALADDHLDSGVPHGAELLAFAEAIVTGAHTLPQTRAVVVEAVGPRAMIDAAGVASNFERMVRIADATGIELGDWFEQRSAGVRAVLELERPAGR